MLWGNFMGPGMESLYGSERSINMPHHGENISEYNMLMNLMYTNDSNVANQTKERATDIATTLNDKNESDA